MDGLTSHIEYRVGNLHREAEARRLAGSATGAAPRAPAPPRRDRRRLAAAAMALAVAIGAGSSGLYLVVASAPEPSAADVPPVVAETAAPAPDPTDRQAVVRLPRIGGIRMHR